ncbi:hypothetical protein BC829DRAFT_426247 [Chytridium lagenaria]|nr:hypothetical protein BC829DRAFT_426247 [Chytridium lagenaria]
MDLAFQQLAAVEREIEDLVKKKTRLQKKNLQETITDEERIELAGIDKLLADGRQQRKDYFELIKLAINEPPEPPESKSFSEADSEWISSKPEFKTAFERVGKAFHQHNEAGRTGLTVETNGPKKRKLYGRTDYTVGFGKGKDMFDNTIPREVHLVAVEAKTSIGEQDLWQCVAEAASLYKIRVDAACTPPPSAASSVVSLNE